MKLTAKDLMIGNWVEIIQPSQGHYTTIQPSSFSVDIGTHYSPIHLTESILTRIGWGKDKEFDNTFIDNVTFKNLVLFYDTANKMLLIETSKDVVEFSHIQYLHELQNRVKILSGKELTFKPEETK